MDAVAPDPEALEDLMQDQARAAGIDSRGEQIRAENLIAAKYWGGIEYRIVGTFVFFAICWVGVIVLGLNSTLPLWVCLILNSVFASMFYMPLHEAVHKNIWGKSTSGRFVEEAIGVLSSIPTGINFKAHRAGHMRHHAYTNDPKRDPDHFTDGRLRELPVKFYGATMLYSFLPFFALIRPLRVLLPKQIQTLIEEQVGNRDEGKSQIRFWLLSTVVLAVCFATGNGLLALMAWWLPAKIQLCWLIFIFAWYPHHPANETSRYRHTRVAVFRGSGLIIRGHDHHAMHHLFPRVAHYRLKALWGELATEMVERGVRTEGRAVGATRPVIW
jgi:beta-carotene hydroxylase